MAVQPGPGVLAVVAGEVIDDDHDLPVRVGVFQLLQEPLVLLAGALVASGSVSGCVATVMENRVELVESCLAIVRAGAVAVCLNPRAGDDELAYTIDDCGATVLITDTAALERVQRSLSSIGRPIFTWELPPRPGARRGPGSRPLAGLSTAAARRGDGRATGFPEGRRHRPFGKFLSIRTDPGRLRPVRWLRRPRPGPGQPSIR
jgi:non-ribosomal peptide synthetase component F